MHIRSLFINKRPVGHLLDTAIRCFRTIRVGTSYDRKDGCQKITVPLSKCQLEINPPRSVPISDMDENGTQSAPCSYLQEAPESLRGGKSSPLRMRLESFRGMVRGIGRKKIMQSKRFCLLL